MNQSILNQMKLANEIYVKIQEIEQKEKQLINIAKLCLSQTDEISNTSITISINNENKLSVAKREKPIMKFDDTGSVSILSGDNKEIPLSDIGGFMGMLMGGMPPSQKKANKSEKFEFKLSNSLLLKIIAVMRNELTQEKTMLVRKYENKMKKQIIHE